MSSLEIRNKFYKQHLLYMKLKSLGITKPFSNAYLCHALMKSIFMLGGF